MKANIISAHQSPMNEYRWLCKLSCGHEQWVTRTGRPRAAECETCKAELTPPPVSALAQAMRAVLARSRRATARVDIGE